MDEPEPLGHDAGPNATRVLSAAVGNCLSASLLFCMQKARAIPNDMKATVTSTIVRNDRGRFRVKKSRVDIQVDIPEEGRKGMGRCLDLFEDFCIVTASVRDGIDVEVVVKDGGGETVYDSNDRHD
jgi:organic hydroperoxide reductase OsmC/OhrA